MKKLLIVLALIAVIIAAGIIWFSSGKTAQEISNQDENQAGTKVVRIENFEYSPSEITIKQGDSVSWTNLDSVKHTVTSDSGSELGSKLLGNGESYSYTFNTAGTFSYYCTPHPYMKARVIVE